MYILGLDTSNGYSYVAVSYNSNIIYSTKDPSKNMQAENLILAIENALKASKITYSQIGYIAASCGPGSFTGIRVALATGRGLSIALPEVKTIGINNFQTIHFRICEQVAFFDYAIASVNAYRGQIYLQKFIREGSEEKPLLLNYDEARKYIESLDGRIAVSGSGIEKLYIISDEIPKNITILPRFPYPDGRFICKVASKLIQSDNINEKLEPLYIREADAKIPSTTSQI
ncbi:MAG: tRNA (adenosine(37)-N6)-threonylcarbamoyltransferase complex dimerization subunit type 1 TsaB [Rickettsiaceae bacterium]|nr:tRNA (adenosine(37)-N6)-threonylcarbamoyltransferase complex dimerization subunit type 1 TsaB [Rickettsiaceae bacterium]